MTDRPKLYPNHRHQWVPAPSNSEAGWPALVACTVCGFTVPRTAATLDGEPARVLIDNHDGTWRETGGTIETYPIAQPELQENP